MFNKVRIFCVKQVFSLPDIRDLFLTILGAFCLILFSGCQATTSQSGSQAMDHHSMVHKMGHGVMPFDLNKTIHIFEMTDTGGIQQVVIRKSEDSSQIPLIRQHLEHEAIQFSAGNYSDPASIHGAQMPGLKDLSANASKVKVEYSTLPNGAQIAFTTQDIHLITAIHRWFGAQLSDHGADAIYR